MLRMVIVEGSEVGVPSDENWTTGLRWGKLLTAPDFRRNGRDQLQRNEIPCQSAVWGVILRDRHHCISRSENSKHGFRRGKWFQAPEFRRKADDRLKDPNIMSINGARSEFCSWRTSRFLLRKFGSGYMWIRESFRCIFRNRNRNERAGTRYVATDCTWPLQDLQNTSKRGSVSSRHWRAIDCANG